MKQSKKLFLSCIGIALSMSVAVFSCNQSSNSENQTEDQEKITQPPLDTSHDAIKGEDTTKFDSTRTEQNPPARRPR